MNAPTEASTASSCDGRSDDTIHSIQSLKSTSGPDIALKLSHSLLITNRVRRLLVQSPLEERIRIIRHEVGVQDPQSLAIVGDLGPVSLDVLQILGQVSEAALEDLPVQWRVQYGFEVDELLPGLLGLREHEVRRALHRTHERAHSLRILRDEAVVADVQNRAEAAAA